jgi:hypothetical protein
MRSAQFARKMDCFSAGSTLILSLLLPLLCLQSHASDVVFVRSVEGSSAAQHALEIATQFYGLNLKIIAADDSALRTTIGQNTTVAVTIAANALPFIDKRALLRALRPTPGRSVPLLILGVTSETDSTLLRSWSGGAVAGGKSLRSPVPLRYVVGRVPDITQQLTDITFPAPGRNTFYLDVAEYNDAQTITEVRDDHQVVPICVEITIHHQKIFMLSSFNGSTESMAEENADNVVNAFAQIAPVMMFIRYCAGERGWHVSHHYANFTIDDPSLREPYGYLDYKALLEEMEKHDFHTTIAFIPWNYNRSEPAVVSLFRKYPERFSICIHGNDHDHEEFTDFRSKPLTVQIAALKQSLARMDTFRKLTGIPYERVFVFPHHIGSERIVEELKKYNFWATINSVNIPADRRKPSNLLFALRPVTTAYDDFPSIERYSAEIANSEELIAINQFLDNPLFFYSHHQLFANGISAFNGIADKVNKREPDTQWRSVGDIVRHLYLFRVRDDSNIDVLSLSSIACLDNIWGRDVIVYVRKQEASSQPIKSVSVDGEEHSFRVLDGYLEVSVHLAAGKTRTVVIEYENDFNLASINASETSLRAYFLRLASDYRDITLYKYAIGRLVVDFYYKHEMSPMLVLVYVLAVVTFTVCGVWRFRVILARQRHSGSNPTIFSGRLDR